VREGGAQSDRHKDRITGILGNGLGSMRGVFKGVEKGEGEKTARIKESPLVEGRRGASGDKIPCGSDKVNDFVKEGLRGNCQRRGTGL